MTFIYTHLEEYIKNLYTSINITTPKQLDPRIIAPKLGMSLLYLPFDSMNSGNMISIDSRLLSEEQWQDFCHELGHAILHSGNQVKSRSLFREYQEYKANNFALQACVPTFMLKKIELPVDEEKAIKKIQLLFNVEHEFAQKRLNHYLNNHGYILAERSKYSGVC